MSFPDRSDPDPRATSGQEEAEEVVAGPGLVATEGMVRGAVMGVFVWGAVGLAIGFAIGMVLKAMGIWGGSWVALGATLVGCGAGGIVFGFISGGLRKGMEESRRLNVHP